MAIYAVAVRSEEGRAPLTDADVAELAPQAGPDLVRAIRVAARGRRDAVEAMIGQLADLPVGVDPVVSIALRLPGSAQFLEVDPAAVRLLELALERSTEPAERALLLAALARELMGDVSTLARREDLIDTASELAERTGDERAIGYVLDARLHALWRPDPSGSRIADADRIVRCGQAVGDLELECRGVFWRFVSLVETGRIGEAESALAVFERLSVDDPAAQLMALARHGMLAILRGRYDFARTVITRLQRSAAELPDAQRLVGALVGSMTFAVGPAEQLEGFVPVMTDLARRYPGHYYDASVARLLATLGQDDAAGAELDRVLPALLAGSGPRWLGAMADAAATAVMIGNARAATLLYDALAPSAGGFVIWAGANSAEFPVDTHLGGLALCTGRPEIAIGHLERAAALQEYAGALPGLVETSTRLADALDARAEPGDAERAATARERARTIATRLGMGLFLDRLSPARDEWGLRLDSAGWVLTAGREHAVLRDARGMHYLRTLLASPRHEIAAVTLASDGAIDSTPSGGAILDESALGAYRARLRQLDDDADAADGAGDAARARLVADERAALLAELQAATGLGGRAREFSSDVERARISVTKALRTALDHIEEQAPLTAAHLRASLRTGRYCRYEPAPGGPARWLV